MAVTNFAVIEPIFVIIQKGYTVNLILFVIVNGRVDRCISMISLTVNCKGGESLESFATILKKSFFQHFFFSKKYLVKF
jgi:hypothetical protein